MSLLKILEKVTARKISVLAGEGQSAVLKKTTVKCRESGIRFKRDDFRWPKKTDLDVGGKIAFHVTEIVIPGDYFVDGFLDIGQNCGIKEFRKNSVDNTEFQ